MRKSEKTATPTSEKILNPCEMNANCYLQDRIGNLAIQLVKFDKCDISQRPKPKKHPYLWDVSKLLRPADQELTQAQMRVACEEIRKTIHHDKWFEEDNGFRMIIDLLDFTQKCGGDTYYLSDSVGWFESMGNDAEKYGQKFSEFERSDARVIIGDVNGVTRALLEAEWIDGKYRYAELSAFSFLSTVAFGDRNVGILTVFHKSLDINHFDVWSGSPRENHAPRTDIPTDAKIPRNQGECILMDEMDELDFLSETNDINELLSEDENISVDVNTEPKNLTEGIEMYQKCRQISLSEAIEILNGYENKELELDGKDGIVVSFAFDEVKVRGGKLGFSYGPTDPDNNFISFPVTTITNITSYDFYGRLNAISFYLSNGEEWRAFHYNLVPLAPRLN